MRLIAATREKVQEFLDITIEASRTKGLSINTKKTEFMVVSKKKVMPNARSASAMKTLHKYKSSNISAAS